MPTLKRPFNPGTVTFGVVLIAGLGAMTDAVALPAGAAEQAAAKKETVDQQGKNGWGRFVAFTDGTLTLESNAGVLLVWHKVAANTTLMKFDPDASAFQRAEDAVAALAQVKAGTWVAVNIPKAHIYVGARKGQVTGTFVAFKNERLLMLGKNLGESFTKKYGNSMHFNRLRDDVPVYESIDGGAYQLIGMANKVLGDVKEGAILTVHGEGDDNITLIQIGAPRK